MEERENEYWEQKPRPVIPAALHKRFANWAVDTFINGFVLSLLFMAIGAAYPPFWESFTKDPYALKNTMTMQFSYALLLSIQEGFFGGKTIAKRFTRTRAVLADGSPLPREKAFLRSLIRMVPFEIFSILIFGRPWHDTWSGTTVVDEDQSRLP